MATRKLKYWIIIKQWIPNKSKSELSQQVSPGQWALYREIRFNTSTERDEWLQDTMDSKSKLVRADYYNTAKASDDNYLFNLNQIRK